MRRAAGPLRLVFGTALLAPLIVAYKLGIFPATRLRRAMTWVSLRGQSERTIRAQGERYAAGLSRWVREEARQRLELHRANGDRIVVVSASLDVYLRPWCEASGFELICTELASREGVLTGGLRGGDCTGREKAERVRARYRLDDYALIYAYGDSAEDEALLALAHRPHYRWRELPARAPTPSLAAERGL